MVKNEQYNSHFFPDTYSYAMAMTLSLGTTLSQVVPIGPAILYMVHRTQEMTNNNNGDSALRDWQWLLIVEGILPILLSPVGMLILPSASAPAPASTPPSASASASASVMETISILDESNSSDNDSDYNENIDSLLLNDNDDNNYELNNTSIKQTTSNSNNLVQLLCDARLAMSTLIFICTFTAYVGLNNWAPTIISQVGHFNLGAAALIFIIPSFISIPIFLKFSGYADQKVGEEIKLSIFGQCFVLFGVLGTAVLLLLVKSETEEQESSFGDGNNTDSRNIWSIIFLVITLTCNIIGQNMFYNTFLRFQNGSLFADYINENDEDNKNTIIKNVGFAIINIGAALGNTLGPLIAGSIANTYGFPPSFFTVGMISALAIGMLFILDSMDKKKKKKEMNIDVQLISSTSNDNRNGTL